MTKFFYTKQNGNDGFSMMRLMSFIILLLVAGLCIFCVWLALTGKDVNYIKEIVSLIGIISGIAFSGKVLQSFAEKKKSS